MIVDDEDVIRNGIVQLADWRAMDCQVEHVCANGQEALNYATEHAVDIVITDIKMPVMDGLTLASELRRIQPMARVIILTAYSDFDYAQKALRTGATDFIVKNDFMTELPAAVANAIRAIRFDPRGRMDRTLQAERRGHEQAEKRAYLLESLLLAKDGRFAGESRALDALNGMRHMVCCAEMVDDDRRLQGHWSDELFEKVLDGHECHAFRTGSGTGIFVISGTLDDEGFVRRVSARLQELPLLARDLLRVRMMLGVSHPLSDARDLQHALKEAREALFRVADPAEHAVVFASDGGAAASQMHLSVFGGEVVRQVEQAQFDAAWQTLCRMMDVALEGGLPAEQVKSQALQVCAQLFDRLRSFGEGIEAREAERDFYQRIVASATLYSLLGVCADLLRFFRGAELASPEERHYLVEALEAYIHQHYTTSISLADISAHLHVSTAYISRLYKSKTGVSITSAINRLRVAQAKTLLRQTTHKVYEIANMVGFEDAGYFAGVFTKFEGMAPGEYRGYHLPDNKIAAKRTSSS